MNEKKIRPAIGDAGSQYRSRVTSPNYSTDFHPCLHSKSRTVDISLRSTARVPKPAKASTRESFRLSTSHWFAVFDMLHGLHESVARQSQTQPVLQPCDVLFVPDIGQKHIFHSKTSPLLCLTLRVDCQFSQQYLEINRSCRDSALR
jgi:hypothetical protein